MDWFDLPVRRAPSGPVSEKPLARPESQPRSVWQPRDGPRWMVTWSTGCTNGTAGRLGVLATTYVNRGPLGVYGHLVGTPHSLLLVAPQVGKRHGEANYPPEHYGEGTFVAPNGYVEPMFHVKHSASLDLGRVGGPG
jgi:hypothetical protein